MRPPVRVAPADQQPTANATAPEFRELEVSSPRLPGAGTDRPLEYRLEPPATESSSAGRVEWWRSEPAVPERATAAPGADTSEVSPSTAVSHGPTQSSNAVAVEPPTGFAAILRRVLRLVRRSSDKDALDRQREKS